MNVNQKCVFNAIDNLLTGEFDIWPFEFDDPSLINNGSCEDFAMTVMAFLNYPDNLTLDCGGRERPHLWNHVWLKLQYDSQTLFFDSECPEGTDRPENLPFFSRQ